MFKKSIVFVDVDETLVRSLYAFQGRLTPTKSCPVFDIDDGEDRVSSMARPDAADFISALNKHNYKVIICTSGSSKFQSRVLKTHGIKGYKKIIGYKEMEGSPLNINVPWVLVDDCDATTSGVIGKMEYFGVQNVRSVLLAYGDEQKQLVKQLITPKLVHVAYFSARKPEKAKPLMSYVPEILEKITAQISGH